MIRDATPAEIAIIFPGNPNTWSAVVEQEGEIVGYLCLTMERGQLFGHETVCESKDKRDALRLWRYAEKHAKALGFDRVHIHEQPDTPERIKAFWQERGAREVFTVYELMLN